MTGLDPIPHRGWGGDCDVARAGDWIVRAPRSPAAAHNLAGEAALLARLAGAPVAVPEPVLAAPDGDGGVALQVYRVLPGEPGGPPASGEGERLGRFLALLTPDQLLLDSAGRLTGVIDFTGAGPDDPAIDFTWWEAWGRTALDEALRAYPRDDPGLAERARTAADLAPLEQVAFGLAESSAVDVEDGRANLRARMHAPEYPDC
jgi:aminoglycoside phosphotransferase (APT) family kinase protein